MIHQLLRGPGKVANLMVLQRKHGGLAVLDDPVALRRLLPDFFAATSTSMA
eukprot:COSAG01_NODE_485_length_16397_cov_48.193827_17_plen_51_part_00